MLKGYSPLLSNDDIMQIIRFSADRVPAMGGQAFDPAYGTGRVNAENALTMVRDNTLRQWTTTGGTSQGSSGLLTNLLFTSAPNLATGVYQGYRHEVRKTVTFPEQCGWAICRMVPKFT